MSNVSRIGLLCLVSMLLVPTGLACSDSDDGDDGASDEGGDSPMPGDGDGDSAMGGDGDSAMMGGDGDATGMGDTGMPADPLMNLPTPTCDSTIPTTATCGGTACPGGGMFAQFTCTVPCCTADDACGTRMAAEGSVTECMAGATEDPSCPGYSGMVMGMAVELPGCCTDGVCGAISSLSMSCITSSMFLTDLAPGPACGGDGGGDADGGI